MKRIVGPRRSLWIAAMALGALPFAALVPLGVRVAVAAGAIWGSGSWVGRCASWGPVCCSGGRHGPSARAWMEWRRFRRYSAGTGVDTGGQDRVAAGAGLRPAGNRRDADGPARDDRHRQRRHGGCRPALLARPVGSGVAFHPAGSAAAGGAGQPADPDADDRGGARFQEYPHRRCHAGVPGQADGGGGGRDLRRPLAHRAHDAEPDAGAGRRTEPAGAGISRRRGCPA